MVPLKSMRSWRPPNTGVLTEVPVSTVGGAAGPLYGTAFLQAGEALGEHQRFGPRLLLEALRASLEGVQRVGAASVGDKTMVDALAPALAAYELELRMGGSLETAVSGAREAAAEGMRATIPLQARKGRASYLGPRSVGHQDPGATSTALMFVALEQAVLADRLDHGPLTGRLAPLANRWERSASTACSRAANIRAVEVAPGSWWPTLRGPR